MRKSVKSAIIHALLLSYTFLPEVLCQQIAATGASMYPNTFYQGNIYGNSGGTKGYSNVQTYPSAYMNSPVHGQYWTGYTPSYPQYTPQQYGAYGSYNNGYVQNGAYGSYNNGYVQNGAYAPQQYSSQPYSQYGQAYYGQYPGFDAQYWTGNFYQRPMPVYHQQLPVYHHGMPVYPAYSAYPNHYYAGGYPYHNKRPGRGFFGGTGNGKLAKTLLGAAAVGVIAGAVARGK